MTTENQDSPVRHFCAQLDAFVRASGQTRSYVVSRHPMSDSQVYAVLAGTVKTPPSFDRMVVPIVEICGGDATAVAQWRTHHDTMVRVHELQRSLRRRTQAEPATDGSAAPAGQPGPEPAETAHAAPPPEPDAPPAGFDVPPGYNRFASAGPQPARRPRWPLLVAAITAVVGVLAGGLIWATAGSDRTAPGPVAGGPASTGRPVAPDAGGDTSPCPGTAPAPGADLLEVPLPDGQARVYDPWWTNRSETVKLERFDTHGWVATAPESADADPWDLLVIRGCLPVRAGHRYQLDFTASADVGATIRARVQNNQDPYDASLTKDLTVGADPQRFSYEFTGALSSPTSELTFQIGGNPAIRVEVRDISLIDLGT